MIMVQGAVSFLMLPLSRDVATSYASAATPCRSYVRTGMSSCQMSEQRGRNMDSDDGVSDDVVGLDDIVRDEMAALARLTPEEQDVALPSLLQRVEERATLANGKAGDDGGYRFGDLTKAAVEATRGEVQRQLDAEWNMNDLSLLLKVGVFLGASATAPVAGLAALPAAALLVTYGTVLKAELGVRAIQEVGARLAERAAQGVADGVRSYTGKDSYQFGDLTEEMVHRVTGQDDYRFGDLTRGALDKAGAALTGQDDYRFGSITEGAVKRVTGDDSYRFGDLSRGLWSKLTGGAEDGDGDAGDGKQQSSQRPKSR